MGQKVNPIGFRVGVIKDWDARWYAKGNNFGDTLIEDIKLRNYIKEKTFEAGISKIEIERDANRIKINLHTAKPGILIGKGGAGIDVLKKSLEQMTGKVVLLNVIEIKKPELDAQLVAENIAFQLERRISFRRAMKQAMSRAMKAGAKGIKTSVSGRLGGAEIARTETYHEGVVPLQTIRADIDYGFTEAKTTYGRIGVKVWINKGEVLPELKKEAAEGGM
ncbi:30S ribosomal protein S3 [Calorimonas adulescens]|uniref:Small ribosomal subunit protein uS3 n=1 Tax=Calorimonas adulescens TaxID=2606906 RepID=A0A5D8QFV1_9THEO|nr:30S ribosomal protein S3 [Calorimonas adulescens]TZE82726.1 30S ribosomal protein S3 [Calorimonas adulescens]